MAAFQFFFFAIGETEKSRVGGSNSHTVVDQRFIGGKGSVIGVLS
jgi:hypothetical protein